MDLEQSDIYINGQGYRASSISRQTAQDFAPKFNSGADDENDLSLLKAKSTENFYGGSFNPIWTDDSAVSLIENASIDPLTGYLRPRLDPESVSLDSLTGTNFIGGTMHTGVFNGLLFVALSEIGSLGLADNRIFTIDQDNTVTELTLPSGLGDPSGVNAYITGFQTSSRHIHVMTEETVMYRTVYPYDGTWETVGTIKPTHAAIAGRNQFYAWANGDMYVYQGGGTWEQLEKYSTINAGEVNATASLNGRPYFGTNEGLYTYDGAKFSLIIDYTSDYSSDNFTFMESWRGWLYYTIGDTIWRFNGATIEKVVDTEQVYNITSMVAGADNLWFTTTLISGNATDVKYGTDNEYSLWKYDGVGTVRFAYETDSSFDSVDVSVAVNGGTVHMLFLGITTNTVNPDILKSFAYDIDGGLTTNLSNSGSSTPASMKVISSKFDAGLPSVDKTFHEVEVDMTQTSNFDYSGSLTIEIEKADGTVETITPTIYDANVFAVNLTYVLGEQATGRSITVTYRSTSGDFVEVKDIIIRYTLNPPLRYQWIATLLLGDSTVSNPDFTDRSGSETGVTGKTQQANLGISLATQTGVEMIFPRQAVELKNALTADETSTVEFNTTLFALGFKNNGEGYIRIDDEIIAVKEVAGTTATITKRGCFGTTATTHSASQVSYKSNHVYLRIVRQNFALQGEEAFEYSGEAMVELTEV